SGRFAFAFALAFGNGTLDQQRGGDDRVAFAVAHQLDTGRQLELRHVDRLADFERRQVDLDEFGQILRQALDVDFVDGVRDHAATELDGRAGVVADEVQRHLQVHLLAGGDAL